MQTIKSSCGSGGGCSTPYDVLPASITPLTIVI